MKFKKPVKILIIVVLILVALYTLFIFIGNRIYKGLSAGDQLKVIEIMYERCKSQNGNNCEDILARNTGDILVALKQEAMASASDGTKPEEERIIALDMFYELSRQENETVDEQEATFYFWLAGDEQSPSNLKKNALAFFLRAKTDNPDIMKLQMLVVADPRVPPDFKSEAIKSLGESGATEAADLLIKNLEDSDAMVRSEAEDALAKIGDKEKIPELLKIAVDKTKMPSTRESAIGAIEYMFHYHGIKDDQTVEVLLPLLQDEYYKVRTAVASAMETLTGEKYEIEGPTEEEEQYFFFGD